MFFKYFDIKGFLKFTFLAWTKTDHPHSRLSLKRILNLLIFHILFFVNQIFFWISFSLDEIIFPNYKQVKVDKPVFIVGFYRSGTTFLHRLMAKDKKFIILHLWEILLAPSILQRKIYLTLKKGLRAMIGPRFRHVYKKLERFLLGDNNMHQPQLDKPEEDQYLFTHIWSSLGVWMDSSFVSEAEEYIQFDKKVGQADKDRIMEFYELCIKRKLYTHRNRTDLVQKGRFYLSKNPAATPKIKTLHSKFPDGKIIYLIRNPLTTIPSMVSLANYVWNCYGDSVEPYSGRDFIFKLAKYWYSYPLKALADFPEKSYIIVKFEDLVSNADKIIEKIYQHFEFKLDANYRKILKQEVEKARNYESSHDYSLEEVGLTKSKIISELSDVFERFDFDRSVD